MSLMCSAIPVTAAGQKPFTPWEQCSKNAEAALERKAAREGHALPYYTGASGFGLVIEVRDACGVKPSPGRLLPAEQRILHEYCQEEYFENLSQVAKSYFWDYGDNSPHVKLAAQTCAAIYQAASARREALLRATPPRTALAQTSQFCQGIGEYASTLVRLRDAGMPPEGAMARASQVASTMGRDAEQRALLLALTAHMVPMIYATPVLPDGTIHELFERDCVRNLRP